MIDRINGQVFYMKKVVNQDKNYLSNSHLILTSDDGNTSGTVEIRNSKPLGSIDLRDLGWSR